MLTLLITILILIVIFALLWYAIGIIPFPPPLANLKWVLYVILIIVAVVVLLGFIPGFHLPA
jgi:hypothetical protein